MSNRFLRRADACTIVKKLSAKAILERKLISPGDRILIAVSGGKDSTVLAWVLSSLRLLLKMNYELEALHISSDFCACCKKAALSARVAEWGIPFTDLEVPIMGRLKPGRKMNCYWCSTQRRTELLRYAIEKRFNKIALGHHLDDIIETFFMNIMTRGTLSAMPIMLSYRKYPISLIRPLAYLEEQQIIACAAEIDIMSAVCTCSFGVNSERREIRKKIAALTNSDKCGAIKRRILTAMSSGPEDLLMETAGVRDAPD
jgi:tRNA 2-thiocytidine biosynthesis protein TtcA